MLPLVHWIWVCHTGVGVIDAVGKCVAEIVGLARTVTVGVEDIGVIVIPGVTVADPIADEIADAISCP